MRSRCLRWVGAVLLAVGCTSQAPVADVAQTVVAVPETGGPAPTLHRLENPEQVEAMVRQFGDCVVERSPDDAGFAIWFDRSTGLVGNTVQVARDGESARQLGEAIYQCDAELVYRPSINAYIEANPLDGAIGPNGLPPAETGEPLPFGDPALLAPVLQHD